MLPDAVKFPKSETLWILSNTLLSSFFVASPKRKGLLSEKLSKSAGSNLLADSGLGLVNYLTRYSGRLATLSAPLRDLTKKGTAYSWGPEHDRAFTEVKKEVSSLGVLRYFDPHKATVIETDALLKGLCAVLLQDGQPVCYAYKALPRPNSDTVTLNVRHSASP